MNASQPGLFDPRPTMPAQRHSETSVAAAEAARPGSGKQRLRVYEAIKAAGAEGMTDLEVQAALGMNPSTQRPRRIELVRAGAVVKTDRKRKTPSGRNAAVYIAPEVI